jgi:L-threonylcarbamoyladenylate synthase
MAELLPADGTGLARAVAILRGGGLVAFPTDTVYGIGCLAGDPGALSRVFEAKRRPSEKAVPVLVASLDHAVGMGHQADDRARALAAAFWPGALTLVLASSDREAGSTTAFRVPDHHVALALIGASGPLATSSANRSGEPETFDADDVLIAFADSPLLDAVLDGGRVPGGMASTVLDLSVTPPRIVREGPITRQRLAEVIGPVD